MSAGMKRLDQKCAYPSCAKHANGSRHRCHGTFVVTKVGCALCNKPCFKQTLFHNKEHTRWFNSSFASCYITLRLLWARIRPGLPGPQQVHAEGHARLLRGTRRRGVHAPSVPGKVPNAGWLPAAETEVAHAISVFLWLLTLYLNSN